MKSYKTQKGTELPLLNLRGKDYLEVKYRVVWFREEHPDWSISTEIVTRGQDFALVKSVISDEKGRVIATAHKYEDVKGFPDYIEKAETGSTGRALALIGYGTQFCADDLDEGKRLVDSPAERPKASKPDTFALPKTFSSELGEYVMTCGNANVKGKKLKEIKVVEIEGCINFFKGKPSISESVKQSIENADAFLKGNMK